MKAQQKRRKAVLIMFGGKYHAEKSDKENTAERTVPDAVEKLREVLKWADTVIIGAGAGLSTSAGFEYTGDRLKKYFHDFTERYGFQDMYSGGFYPYETLEEYWAYWSRYIYCNRYTDPAEPVYQNLLKLVEGKDYFVLTTNVDHCFQKAGFDKKRLFYTQGDYGLFQCSKPCHKGTYDNKEQVFQMMAAQGFVKDREGSLILPEGITAARVIPTELIPRCPVCGRAMAMNLRADSSFVEDAGWHEAAKRYDLFLRSHRNRNVLFLEAGTGFNTPGIIKYSFWQMTAEWPAAVYACLNLGEAFAPKEIQNQSVCINGDAGSIIRQLLSPVPEHAL